MHLPKRPHKFRREDYRGTRSVAMTVALESRIAYFVTEEVVAPHRTCIARACERGLCNAPIYCFMPDHLHILFMGTCEDSDLKQTMDYFKLLSGLTLHRMKGPRWQAGYFDHTTRTGQDWRHQACYIAQNPVRRGLVEDPFLYPFLGNVGGDLQDVILPIG